MTHDETSPPDGKTWQYALYSTDPADQAAYANDVLADVARSLGLEKGGQKPFAAYDIAKVTPEEVARDFAGYQAAVGLEKQGLKPDLTTPAGKKLQDEKYADALPIAQTWVEVAHERLTDKKDELGLTFNQAELGFVPVFLGDMGQFAGDPDPTREACAVQLPAVLRAQQLQDAANTWHEIGHAIDNVTRKSAGDTNESYPRHRAENLADTFMTLQMVARYGKEGVAYSRDRAASRIVDIGQATRDNPGQAPSLAALTTRSMQRALDYAQQHDLSNVPPADMFKLAQTLSAPMPSADYQALGHMLGKRGALPVGAESLRALAKDSGTPALERRFLFDLAENTQKAPVLEKQLQDLNPLTTNPDLRRRVSLRDPLSKEERVELGALDAALRGEGCPPFEKALEAQIKRNGPQTPKP